MDDLILPSAGEWLPSRVSDDLVDHWLSGKSADTVRAYRRDLIALAEHLEIDTVDRDAATRAVARLVLEQGQAGANRIAIGWRGAMLDSDMAPATVNRRLSALRSIVRLARLLGLATWDLDVENTPSRKYRDTSGPGPTVIHAMLEAAATRGDAKGLRDRAIVSLAYHLALRRSEITRLDLAHVDLDAHTITIRGKGRREPETLDVPLTTMQTVQDWIAVRGDHAGPLFESFAKDQPSGRRLTPCGVWYVIRECGRSVDEQVAPHGLRHTGITQACIHAQRAGLPLPAVLPYSRHSDLAVLQLYVDNLEGMQGKIARMVAGDQG